jgi:putative transposase
MAAAEPARPNIFIPVTNSIKSLNARFRQACRNRDHFSDEQSALKVLYLVIATPHKNWTNVTGGTPGWKEAVNGPTMYYGNRISVS